jgi:hypothetical protein
MYISIYVCVAMSCEPTISVGYNDEDCMTQYNTNGVQRDCKDACCEYRAVGYAIV